MEILLILEEPKLVSRLCPISTMFMHLIKILLIEYTCFIRSKCTLRAYMQIVFVDDI
ncbi:hypothetical protein CEAn_00370 [Coxiella endosymbiont of Amblyomma nuttalli]|nr:hypothetical protein CEAn_00370 [Coxiella endosymbiont of Amblyomma nuttalli]